MQAAAVAEDRADEERAAFEKLKREVRSEVMQNLEQMSNFMAGARRLQAKKSVGRESAVVSPSSPGEPLGFDLQSRSMRELASPDGGVDLGGRAL